MFSNICPVNATSLNGQKLLKARVFYPDFKFIFVLILPFVSCSSPERTSMEFFESMGKGELQKAYNMMYPLKESRMKNDLAGVLLLFGSIKNEKNLKKPHEILI
ncbi:MAG: hypothetical protein ACPLN0_00385 [Candidatus Hydrothermia bacterium]